MCAGNLYTVPLQAFVIEGVKMAKSWWNVTGQYSYLTDKGKKANQRFNNHFFALNKTDAINQAKEFFEKMKKSDPGANYSNFTKINASQGR